MRKVHCHNKKLEVDLRGKLQKNSSGKLNDDLSENNNAQVDEEVIVGNSKSLITLIKRKRKATQRASEGENEKVMEDEAIENNNLKSKEIPDDGVTADGIDVSIDASGADEFDKPEDIYQASRNSYDSTDQSQSGNSSPSGGDRYSESRSSESSCEVTDSESEVDKAEFKNYHKWKNLPPEMKLDKMHQDPQVKKLLDVLIDEKLSRSTPSPRSRTKRMSKSKCKDYKKSLKNKTKTQEIKVLKHFYSTF